MKKYKVIFHSDAEADIESSYKWGCRAWGEENAKQRAQKLRRAIGKQTHIIAHGLSRRAGERTIGCFHPAFDRRTLSRPLHG